MKAIEPGQARRVRLVVLDVDGVLTDNGLYIGQVQGERVELKKFHAQDGLGLHLLRLAGIPVAWLSGRESVSTSLRAAELGVTEVVQDGAARKYPALEAMLNRRELGWRDVLYVGDDLADVPVMRRAGIAIAVANAVEEVRREAAVVTESAGGQGAVREVVELLLKGRGEWEATLDRYYRERGDVTD